MLRGYGVQGDLGLLLMLRMLLLVVLLQVHTPTLMGLVIGGGVHLLRGLQAAGVLRLEGLQVAAERAVLLLLGLVVLMVGHSVNNGRSVSWITTHGIHTQHTAVKMVNIEGLPLQLALKLALLHVQMMLRGVQRVRAAGAAAEVGHLLLLRLLLARRRVPLIVLLLLVLRLGQEVQIIHTHTLPAFHAPHASG